MATGYTQRIIDGEITNFKDFALLCTRAFGATVHMRDESLDEPINLKTVSTYHSNSISDNLARLKEVKEMSNEDYFKLTLKTLKEDLKRYEGYIEKANKNKITINNLLKEAKEFTPPTPHHEEFKNFMINQLEMTLLYDCDDAYYTKEASAVRKKIATFLVEEEREKEIEQIEKNIEYHKKRLNEEIIRVNDSNKWIKDLYEVLFEKN